MIFVGMYCVVMGWMAEGRFQVVLVGEWQFRYSGRGGGRDMLLGRGLGFAFWADRYEKREKKKDEGDMVWSV